ncbi:MAG: ATP-binding protein [Deltaproteobacteria bacterium]|jgi:general secretion pathway protein A|nr:ATP-binding protein [Deltaproteobacteria bacterium]MBT6613805.1 ATP-binding protein [Deltaproteobacteria bacterium]MBT7712667.1 ATP-binding protein [Deltaproteobacteria bacterium]MBT7892503.1 ATP-binding protein [Deltaproteobacteria bacterium]
MNQKKLLALYGLKWNPFLPDIPVEALWQPPSMQNFVFRLENLVMDGGFALISGEPGLGKSKLLQLVSNKLGQIEDVKVGVMERPQGSLADFYRELGSLFDVNLTPSNRYGGFKALRERWNEHIKRTLFRPVLLIDEAQEMASLCMNELRLLSSAHFDSRCLLTTIICGDTRLPGRFRQSDLVSLGSRIRVRNVIEPYHRHETMDYLEYSLKEAGADHLMSVTLKETLVEHAGGNLRMLNNMAAELLAKAAQEELTQMDEKLFLSTFTQKKTSAKRKKHQ